MTIVFGVMLALLGVALWVFAGLLPVARILRGDKDTVSVGLVTTWMGSLALSSRQIDGVRGARLAPDPDAARKAGRSAGRKSKVELRVNGEWQELAIRFTQDATAKAQFVGLLQQYLKAGGPRVLALPLRGRMNMMKRFLVFFPLGTASIFTSILLITGLAN
ncbi:MAG: hypothetical protein MUQ30_01135 [Anaerolineae bacterium]|nr:hypothetical protein [Anaerolineae bacterium]